MNHHRSVLFLQDDNNNNDNNNNDVDNQEILFGMPMAGFTADADLHKSLRNRQMSLHDGVGKRYVVRTQKGFLNVHLEPTSAFDTGNIISQLKDGQVVTSTGPTRGIWVRHDGGGWSVADYQGFTWLEPLDE